MKLTTANYHNSLNAEYRRSIQTDVQRQRLAHIAHQPQPARNFQLPHHLKKSLVLFIVIVASMLLASVVGAQDRHDPGDFTAFPDAMIAYRVGHYYFVQGDYQRAVDQFTAAVDSIPAELFEHSNDYVAIYWDMGEAQFMNGEYAAALASYQRYLELSRDHASDEAVAYVEQFQQAFDSDTLSQMTLLVDSR